MISAAGTVGVGTVLVLGLLTGCGGDDSSPEREAAPSGEQTVAIEDFAFDPASISVDAGSTVQVVNRDSATHTLTASDGSFDTGDLGADETGEIVLEEPGEHEFICEIHQYMRGTITVR